MRIISLLILPLLLIGCNQDSGAAKAAPNPAAAPAKQQAAKQVSLEEAKRSLPGYPMERVSPLRRGKLIDMAEDEFVYDGSPFTLAGCIRDDRSCKDAALRGLGLLESLLASGARDADALATYNRYYRSFDNRETIDLAGAACMGPEDATVTLVAFSDFECPYCNAARPLLEGAVKQRDDVKFCFMQFPLPGHTNAMSASQATVFAQRHGKFWELHDLIFDNQRRLSDQTIRSLVQQVGLDFDALAKEIRSGALAEVVEKQKAEGLRLGVQGTPAIFINGRKLEIPMSPELLQFTIEDEARWQAAGGAWVFSTP